MRRQVLKLVLGQHVQARAVWCRCHVAQQHGRFQYLMARFSGSTQVRTSLCKSVVFGDAEQQKHPPCRDAAWTPIVSSTELSLDATVQGKNTPGVARATKRVCAVSGLAGLLTESARNKTASGGYLRCPGAAELRVDRGLGRRGRHVKNCASLRCSGDHRIWRCVAVQRLG